MSNTFTTPILFIVYNRPELTQITFNEISKINPSKLFIAVDGPRNQGDVSKCEEVLNICKNIYWQCDVKFLIRKENLGCGLAVSGAINWFFENVEEGIILEDDCMPSESFFNFCTIMLNRYRCNKNVMHISGSNFQLGNLRGDASYYYSKYPLIWGWATWKRAWSNYNYQLPSFKNKTILHMGLFFIYASFLVNRNKINTWDIQWSYAVFKKKGICITPNTNLIKNIGYGQNSTHTNKPPSWESKMHYGELNNIRYPHVIKFHNEADNFLNKTIYNLSIIKYLKKLF